MKSVVPSSVVCIPGSPWMKISKIPIPVNLLPDDFNDLQNLQNRGTRDRSAVGGKLPNTRGPTVGGRSQGVCADVKSDRHRGRRAGSEAAARRAQIHPACGFFNTPIDRSTARIAPAVNGPPTVPDENRPPVAATAMVPGNASLMATVKVSSGVDGFTNPKMSFRVGIEWLPVSGEPSIDRSAPAKAANWEYPFGTVTKRPPRGRGLKFTPIPSKKATRRWVAFFLVSSNSSKAAIIMRKRGPMHHLKIHGGGASDDYE